MADVITVDQLLLFCKAEHEKGNGNKKIAISRDDEGNGYHDLFFSFTQVKDVLKYLDDCQIPNCRTMEKFKDEYIILGWCDNQRTSAKGGF